MKKTRFISVLFMGLIILSLSACGKTSNKSSDTKADKTETFVAYYQDTTDEDVVVGDEACYVDGQILLTAAEDISQMQVEKIVETVGGTIVGYISISNDYQIVFEEKKTYDELIEITNLLANNDSISFASLNYVSIIDSDSVDYTQDPWMDADNGSDESGFTWSEFNPDGNNWWAEAVMMPSVWNMDLNFQKVKVGIYDSMFDTDNEDLDEAFTKIWNAPNDENGNCMVSDLYKNAKNSNKSTRMFVHGTHVAGIIAAKAENGFGIAGISQNAELYGFSFCSNPVDTEEVSRWGDIFEIKYAVAIMLNEGVKVINFSIAFNDLLVAAQNGVESALSDLEQYSNSLEKFLKNCLDAGYDFVIVKAAGNDNAYNWVKCEVSNQYPYGYKIDGASKTTTNYDAKYDVFGAIEDENVKEHILIVGAAENNDGYYTTASFSEIGERIDVYAPGVDILSDYPTNITTMSSGTSMAAPIVTGIVALIWGANPDLSATQVVNIIRTSTYATLFSEEINEGSSNEDNTTAIVNAYVAVQMALKESADNTITENVFGAVMGMVYSKQNDGSYLPLEGAAVTVDNGGNIIDKYTTYGDNLGYTFVLQPGKYTVTASLDGYITESKDIIIEENDVIDLDFEMEVQGSNTEDDSNSSETNWESIYSDVLDLYYYEITSEWVDYWDNFGSGEYTFTDIFQYYYYDSNYINQIGYSFIDLDDNGIPELLIGMKDTGIYDDFIMDLFTYVDGQVVQLASSADRGSYYLCEDNTIYSHGSNGASDWSLERYCLQKGEDTLTLIETVFGKPNYNNTDCYFYYSTKGVNEDEATQITESEADSIEAGWPNIVQFKITTFDNYVPSSQSY